MNWKSTRLLPSCFSCVTDLPAPYKSGMKQLPEYFYFHLQPLFSTNVQVASTLCVNVSVYPKQNDYLGSVLQLLQLQRPQQRPPGEQRHRWDREVVAEPPPLQRAGPQRGECHPGSGSGETVLFFLCCKLLLNRFLRVVVGETWCYRRGFLVCVPPPPSTLPKHSYDPIYSWSGITLGGDGHVSSPRTTSTPSLASKYASTPVALWLASRRNCTSNLRNSASRSQKIQNQVVPLGWKRARVAHLAPRGRSLRQ